MALCALWGTATAQTTDEGTTHVPEEFVKVVNVNWKYVEFTVLVTLFLLVVAMVGVSKLTYPAVLVRHRGGVAMHGNLGRMKYKV